ncbi:hypothetical protein K9N68_39350 (plasmid) [Kovacikia minuta CCNUW1]|uniref:hypothetical protein n=1 Tax=Kovacikia minuta TaxID=2931930 RepID=UPI001CCC2849|nr:hypothetical protein [Kovacikia minuta]UBF30195.1 hypothetical protein K9N68_39350 [Kovacikia minuta CCNUW1]
MKTPTPLKPTPIPEVGAEQPQPAQPAASGIDLELASLETELETFPIVSDKKIGVRLEKDIQKEILAFCDEQDITPETLLEAFYTVCKSKDSLIRQVAKEAQSRIQRRIKAGNIRSMITKLKNLKTRKY